MFIYGNVYLLWILLYVLDSLICILSVIGIYLEQRGLLNTSTYKAILTRNFKLYFITIVAHMGTNIVLKKKKKNRFIEVSVKGIWKWKSLSLVWLFVTPWTSLWNSPGQNTGVGSLSLLQWIVLTQGLNPGLPHCRQILNQLSHKGSPRILEWVAYSFPRGSSQPRNQTGVSCIAGVFFTNWAMREALQKASTWILNLLKTKKQKYIILSRNDCFLLDHRTIFLLWKFHRCSKNVIQFT